MTVLDAQMRYSDEIARLTRARPGAVDEHFAEPLPMLVVDGHGLAHGSDFMDIARSLRSLGEEVVRRALPSGPGPDRAQAPIEAVFPSLAQVDRWRLRLALPPTVTAAQVAAASADLAVVGRAPIRVRLRPARRTLWLQTLVRRRSGADAGLAVVVGFARSRGYRLADYRHELYLSGLSWGESSEPDVVVRYRVSRPVTVWGRAAAGIR